MSERFKDPFQGVVDANGSLVIKFGPPYNNKWDVAQVSLEMPTAPAGASALIRCMGSLVAPSPSARVGAASGDPYIPLHGGETMTVEWQGCTPGTPGKVWVVYYKDVY